MNAVWSFIVGVVLMCLLLGAVAAGAQQITDAPASLSAITSISGDRIPAPPAKVSGRGSSVDDNDYKVTVKFTFNRITLTFDGPKPTPADEKRLPPSSRDKKVSD